MRQTLNSVVTTVNMINRRSEELERARRQLGPAQVADARALELQRNWEQGVQILPLYPVELARTSIPIPYNQTYSAPYNAAVGAQGPLLYAPRYVEGFDEAALNRRDWVRFVRTADPAPAAAFNPGTRSQWRVETLADVPVIPQPPPEVVSNTVTQMMRTSNAHFVPGSADAYGFSFSYKPLGPTAVSESKVASPSVAPSRVEYVPANLASGYYAFREPLPAKPIAPNDTERTYSPSELPTFYSPSVDY